MVLTIRIPDELGQRVRELPDPDRFITEALHRALNKVRLSEASDATPSKWAQLAAEIEADPIHLDGYSDEINRKSREFRKGFAFLNS